LTSGLTPTPTLTTAVPPISSVTVIDAWPVLVLVDTVKVTGPGPGWLAGATLAIVVSEVAALNVDAPVSVALKVCDGEPVPANESVIGETVIEPLVTETITFCDPP
jgi:hypothetical protein